MPTRLPLGLSSKFGVSLSYPIAHGHNEAPYILKFTKYEMPPAVYFTSLDSTQVLVHD